MRKVLAASVAVLAGALCVLSLSSCGSPCQDLGARICGCQPPGTLQDACNTAVKNQIGNGSQKPGPADQTRCQQLLQTCVAPAAADGRVIEFCYFLQSSEGKLVCGIADPVPDGGSPDGGTPDGGTDGGP